MPFCHLPMSQKPQAWQCSQTHTLQPVLQERAIFELPAVPYQCDILCRCQARYHNNSLTLAFFWDDVLQFTSLLLPTTVCDGAGIAPLSTWGQHLWQCQLQISSAALSLMPTFVGILKSFFSSVLLTEGSRTQGLGCTSSAGWGSWVSAHTGLSICVIRPRNKLYGSWQEHLIPGFEHIAPPSNIKVFILML